MIDITTLIMTFLCLFVPIGGLIFLSWLLDETVENYNTN